MRTSIVCAICGEPHNGEAGWFLLTENRWTDRVKVLAFNPLLAGEEGIFCVCGRAHVRELVVHWMVTGRLDYPFAEFPSPRPARTRSERRQPAARAEPNVATSAVIGELAVDRESLMRVLGENPESLSAILEALVAGLNAAPVPISCSCCAEGQEGADNTELALTQA